MIDGGGGGGVSVGGVWEGFVFFLIILKGLNMLHMLILVLSTARSSHHTRA